ncbi:hypothetical protein EJB05_37094 [Eragrostis curvula]|uniref:NADP-dependent oxidoreductase domain-containing protein n=1 Tax=Eragrostis curvula TaxID=38414 RepID=A0A5J9TQQ8_9POAL|nr:hypothetical protein EJB05_37094 [Eragrostis curvula]
MAAAPVMVPRMKLGSQGLEVSAQGLGCLGMAGFYGPPKPEADMIALINHAVASGVTFFDTSDFYGPHTNEILLGKALQGGVREKVQLATKFGIRLDANGEREVHGDPAYVRAACEGSLKRLGIDCIDLYYQHRIDTRVPVEVTIGELKKLVQEGKIKYIGLSEASVSTIRRAHAVHPITAVELEWSLWSRDAEEDIIPTCRELGIGIVAYSPLGRGFLSRGPKLMDSLSEQDFRRQMPRLQPENLDKNLKVFERVTAMATRKGCTPSQLALAWVHHQGNDVCPIPGTTKVENFNQNVGALSVKLSPDEMAELESYAAAGEVQGDRYPSKAATWKDSETPPLSSWKSEPATYDSQEHLATAAMVMVPRMKLGSQGLEVSAQGLGCMGMSAFYGPPKPEADMIALIRHAVASGVTFLDTSDMYGPHTNEILLGKAMQDGVREKVQLATKFGVIFGDKPAIRGDPAYVRAACEASLKRLGIDCIDLYYQHRIDTTVPIEVTLVQEGKIKYIGLSEASASTIRRAHAVHPITAVQLEWSLWTRDAEEDVIPTCRELGIGIVAYCPMGGGFLSAGPKLIESLSEQDFRRNLPRFQPENLDKNLKIFEHVNAMATRKCCTPSQLALAWVHHQGNDVCPIPGTTKVDNFNMNLGALSMKLTAEEMAELESYAAAVQGDRFHSTANTWKDSETPPLSSWKSE